MKTFTIRQAIADSSWGMEPGGVFHAEFVRCIYVIREEDSLFYVGMTELDFCTRLRWHLAIETRGKNKTSPIGECIIANWPESLNWTVDLWKPNEIKEKYSSQEDDLEWILGLKEAESYLIRRFRPPLNSAGREYMEGPLLPDRYRQNR